MSIRVDEIKSLDWQPKLNEIGQVVENVDDINQCILIILTTRKGSRPHEPEFGSDIWKYLDQPVDVAIPGIILEAMEAINTWENRARVISIDVISLFLHHATLLINWKLKDYDVETYTMEVSI